MEKEMKVITKFSFASGDQEEEVLPKTIMLHRSPKMPLRRVPPKISQKDKSGTVDEEATAVEEEEDCGRERLKRHRTEVAGQVRVPDKWSQEELLKEWIDYSTFDALLAPKGLASAREALIAEGRRARGLRIKGTC